MIGRLAVGLLLCLSVAKVQAEVMVGNSLEWLSISTPVIVQGTVETSADTAGQQKITVRVTQVLKGKYRAKQVTVTVTTWTPRDTRVNPVQHACLLFLRPADKDPVDTFIGCRSSGLTYQSFIDLDAPQDVYSKAMTCLTDTQQILGIIKKWAVSPVSQSLLREVDFSSPIHPRLFGGSAVYLVVPVEECYRAEYLREARTPGQMGQSFAVAALRYYPGPETEALLQKLLHDDSWCYATYAADTIASVKYDVRAAAVDSLHALGKPTPADIVVERKPTAEEQRMYRQGYWRKSFTDALPAGWIVTAIADGETHPTFLGEMTGVLVTVRHDETTAIFCLIPKDWTDVPPPAGKYLGFVNAQGGRQFNLDGNLPQDVEAKVVQYFGVEHK